MHNIDANRRLGEQIGMLRRDHCMTQIQLAAAMVRAGYPAWTYATVKRTEVGDRYLRFFEGCELAKVLDVSTADLVAGTSYLDDLADGQVARMFREREQLVARLRVLDILLAYTMTAPL